MVVASASLGKCYVVEEVRCGVARPHAADAESCLGRHSEGMVSPLQHSFHGAPCGAAECPPHLFFSSMHPMIPLLIYSSPPPPGVALPELCIRRSEVPRGGGQGSQVDRVPGLVTAVQCCGGQYSVAEVAAKDPKWAVFPDW